MQRFFLSKIVTRDINGEPEGPAPALTLLRDPKDATKTLWPQGTRINHLDYTGFGWALSLVTHHGDAANPHGSVPIPDDPDVVDVPEFALDAKLTGMDQQAYTKLVNFITEHVQIGSINRTNDSLREVIRRVGQKVKPDFNESYFGIS